MYNTLSANFSWETTVFSLPSIIKYPPTSFLHSPTLNRAVRDNPFNTQKSDCIITGKRPKYIFFNVVVRFNTLSSVLYSSFSCKLSLVVISISSVFFFFFAPPDILNANAFSIASSRDSPPFFVY